MQRCGVGSTSMAGGVAVANATCASALSTSLTTDAFGPGGLRATLVNVVLAGACWGSRGLSLGGHKGWRPLTAVGPLRRRRLSAL